MGLLGKCGRVYLKASRVINHTTRELTKNVFVVASDLGLGAVTLWEEENLSKVGWNWVECLAQFVVKTTHSWGTRMGVHSSYMIEVTDEVGKEVVCRIGISSSMWTETHVIKARRWWWLCGKNSLARICSLKWHCLANSVNYQGTRPDLEGVVG